MLKMMLLVVSKLLESFSFELLPFVYRCVHRPCFATWRGWKWDTTVGHLSFCKQSSFMHGSLLLGMFVVSILRVSVVLSLLSLTHNWKIMTYLLSVLNLCDNDNKQINLTDKYVKGRIWWSYFVYNQGHLVAWREKEVEHFIGSGLVVFVLFSFGLVIKS